MNVVCTIIFMIYQKFIKIYEEEFLFIFKELVENPRVSSLFYENDVAHNMRRCHVTPLLHFLTI